MAMNLSDQLNDAKVSSIGSLHVSSSGTSSGPSSGLPPSELYQLINTLGIEPDQNNVGAQVREREYDSSSSTTAIPKRACDKSELSHTFISNDGGVSGFSGPNGWIPNGDTVDIFSANNSFTTSSATKNPSLSYQHNAAVGPGYTFSSENSFPTPSATENPSASSYQHSYQRSMDSSRHAAAAQNYHQRVPVLPIHAAPAEHHNAKDRQSSSVSPRHAAPAQHCKQPVPTSPTHSAPAQHRKQPVPVLAAAEVKTFLCNVCKTHTKHSIERLSVHCRVGKAVKETYDSIACLECKTESSPCPNRGKFDHPKGNLIWVQIPSKHTREQVWELACPTCLAERARRKADKFYDAHKKITVKWTRCNYCKALYKKGKGVKGVRSSDKCRILNESNGDMCSPAGKHSPRNSPRNSPRTHSHAPVASPHAAPSRSSSSKHIDYVERLLAKNAFAKFPPDLQKRIVDQCQDHV